MICVCKYIVHMIPIRCPIGRPTAGGEGGGGEGGSGDCRTPLREQEERVGTERSQQDRQTAGTTKTR